MTLLIQNPTNPYHHPLLHEAFNEGVEIALEFISRNQEDGALSMSSTYAAISRTDMYDVFDECQSLGLVPGVGKFNQ